MAILHLIALSMALASGLLQAGPSDLSVPELTERGVAALRQEKVQEAAYYFRQAVSKDPSNSELQRQLGEVLVDIGQPQEAVTSLRKALEMDPVNSRATIVLGGLLGETGRAEEGEQLLEEFLKGNPESGEAHFQLALIQDAGGNEESARQHYLAAINARLKEPRAHMRLCIFYSREGDQRKSLEHLASAFSLQPEKYVPKVLNELRKVQSDIDGIRYLPEFQDLLEKYRQYWPRGNP